MVPQRLLPAALPRGGMDGWMLAGMDARFAMLHILHASADYSHSRGSIGVAPERAQII